MLAEIARRNEVRRAQVRQDNLGFATSDLAKSLFSLSIWFICQQIQGVDFLSIPSRAVIFCGNSETCPELPTYNGPFHAHGLGVPTCRNCSDCRETMSSRCSPLSVVTLTLASVRSTLSTFVVGLAYTFRAYIVYTQFTPVLRMH